MVQRFKGTGHPVFKSTSALSRGIVKQKKGRITTHFNGDSFNTELLFQTVHSVNQLHGAVANWCHLFALTEEEEGQVGIVVVDDKKLTMVEPEKVELLVSPPTQALGNRMQGGAVSFQTLEKNIQLTQLCEKSLLPTSCDRREDVQKSTDCRRRVVRNYSFVSRMFEFSIFSENPSIVSYS